MAAASTDDHSYSFCNLQGRRQQLMRIECDAQGAVSTSIRARPQYPSDTGDLSTTDSVVVKVTAENCNWNVYATKKPCSTFQTQNRPPIIEVSMSGKVFRIGNRVILPNDNEVDTTFKSFIPMELSLSLNEIEQHGRFLVVTSRQKVVTAPVPERDAPRKVEIETQNGIGSRITIESGGKDEKRRIKTDQVQADSKPENSVNEGGSASESDAEDLYQLSASEEELSACESWSEGSTDLDEVGIEEIQELPVEIPLSTNNSLSETKKVLKSTGNITNSDSTATSVTVGDESDSELPSEASTSDDDSDSDTSIACADNQRYKSEVNNEDEQDRMVMEVYVNDRIETGPNEDSEEDDSTYCDAYDETGWAVFGDADDFDGDFVAFESDSDDCSECGDDGGACTMPTRSSEPSKSKGSLSEEEAVEQPLGMPRAQLHVYDTSAIVSRVGETLDFKRAFRFEKMVTQTLHNSPPVIHTGGQLLVWPIGDSKILFADYRHNTYFMKRLRLSRLFSQHVSIHCHFSFNGDFLHIAALERRGHPPIKSKKTSRTERVGDQKKLTQEPCTYDAVVSTYRLSRSKTARSSPRLVHQTRQNLGPINKKYALPTFEWQEHFVDIAYATADKQAQVWHTGLFRKAPPRETVEQMPQVFDTKEELVGKRIYMSPTQNQLSDSDLNGFCPFTSEIQQIRPFFKPESLDQTSKSEDAESQASNSVGTLNQTMVL